MFSSIFTASTVRLALAQGREREREREREKERVFLNIHSKHCGFALVPAREIEKEVQR